MAGQIWHGLLANLAILVLVVSVATHTYARRARWPDLWRQLSLGALFGVGTTVLMLFPVEITPGFHSDLRAALLGLGGFFGGPVTGIIVAVMAAAYRLSAGGGGAVPGVIGISLSALVGVAGYIIATQRRSIRFSDVLILAAWTALAAPAGILFVSAEMQMQMLTTTTFPLVLLVFTATVLSGLAMLQERQRLESFEDNRTYRAIIENLPDPLNVKDVEGRFIAANQATAQLMGAKTAGELIGKTDFDFYRPDTAERFRADDIASQQLDAPAALEQEINRPDGERIWLSTLKVPVRGDDGTPIALITHNRDVTERKRLEAHLSITQQHFAAAMASMADALAMFDADGRLVFCNELYRSFFPKTADLRVPGTPLRAILEASIDRGEQVNVPPAEVDTWINQTMINLFIESEDVIQRYDGNWLHIRATPMHDGSAMVVISDVTKIKHVETELKAMTAQLQILATTDGLTGLTNRRALDDRLAKELLRTERSRQPLSFVLIDIDRFKLFNDLYGHPAGDECLKRVAVALRNAVKRPADIVARYGGEEMAVVLPDTSEDGAFAVAEACRLAVRDLALEHARSEKGVVTVSLGVATYAADDIDRDNLKLIGRADEALYVAKEAGRDRVHGWTPRRPEAATG